MLFNVLYHGHREYYDWLEDTFLQDKTNVWKILLVIFYFKGHKFPILNLAMV